MRNRLLALVAAATAVSLAFPATANDNKTPPVMDGIKVKELSFEGTGALQANETDTGSTSQRVNCQMPRCAHLDFIYKPAGTFKADLYVEAVWDSPLADVDVYFTSVGADGRATDVLHCASFGGSKERVFVPQDKLKPGQKYRVVVDFYRTYGTKVTTKVQMPGTNQIPKTTPFSDAINCAL